VCFGSLVNLESKVIVSIELRLLIFHNITHVHAYVFKSRAPKKPVNLSINSELLAEAKRLKLNLSATLEQTLEKEIRTTLRKKLLADNKAGIEACNELAENYGLFADKRRV